MQPRRPAVRSDSLVVAYCGRGAVVWRDGRIRFAGPRHQQRRELEIAVQALLEMEGIEIGSVDQVRDALLTIGGARVLRDLPRTTVFAGLRSERHHA